MGQNDGVKSWETHQYITREVAAGILREGTPKPIVPGRAYQPKAYVYNNVLCRYQRINFYDLRTALAVPLKDEDKWHDRVDLYVERSVGSGEILYVRVG